MVPTDRLSILYRDLSPEQVCEHFQKVARCQPDPTTLAALLPVKAVQTFDSYLSDELLDIADGQRLLNINGSTGLVSYTLSLLGGVQNSLAAI
jgi:hypothetical protein